VADLAALPSRGEERLSWRPSPEPDVGLYVVYRASGGAPAARVGSVRPPATTFVDREVAPGTYRYTVTAQDTTARANESRPSNETTVSVP
jgi:fibronectin type 3 domain-containing protein